MPIMVKAISDTGLIDICTSSDVDAQREFLLDMYELAEMSVSNGERKRVTITVEIM